MDRLGYTALSGMRHALAAQTVTANNAANAATPGFRADSARFGTAWLAAGGEAARAPSRMLPSFTDGTAGTAIETGRALDVALMGDGWLCVSDAQGRPALTRRGDLRLDEAGTLRTGDGFTVQGDSGDIRITDSNGPIDIAADGSISTLAPDGQRTVVDRISLATMPAARLAKQADGLYRAADGGDIAPDPLARLQPGHLEQASVNLADAMVDLVEQSRAFELHARMIATLRQLDDSSARLMRVDN